MEEVRIKFNVCGLVQGVGFRYFVLKNAMEFGVRGYVKNLLDGSVAGLAIGEESRIAQFKAALRKGPSRSRVERVVVEEDTTDGNYLTFSIH